MAERKLLLVAVCSLNQWTADEIVTAHRLTRAECVKRLLELDGMGLLTLLPGDRIRLRVMRDFDWLADGLIRAFFMQQGLHDFLDSQFAQRHETLEFAHAMLTAPAREQLQLEMQRLRARLALLHEESAAAPLAQRQGLGCCWPRAHGSRRALPRCAGCEEGSGLRKWKATSTVATRLPACR